MKKILLTLALVAVAGCMSADAHNRKALRINEVMVENNSSIVDEYGERSAWIEIFNANFAPLDISSIYITNDPEQRTLYPVPLGDEATHMGKRQHVVFWADDNATHGTFHTSFKLVPGQDNWIGIYDADGITLLDEVTVPASLLPDQSYARVSDGADEWEVRDNLSESTYITPASPNIINGVNDRVQTFYTKDRNGFSLTLMGICIVFSALLVLCLCFWLINKAGAKIAGINKLKSQGATSSQARRASSHTIHDSGEEIAAIVMALHEHLDAHDTEKTVLTINKVKKAYSPWSSKIYSMRELPNRK